MKSLSLLLLATLIITTSFGQKFYTKNGNLKFDATSATSPEQVDAINRQVICVLDTKTGAIQFSVLMKGFQFEKALMEEHFNENYVESSKYPKAEFKGTITNNTTINYLKDGAYPVTVKGKLLMHGESRDVETTGKITVTAGKISATANFNVALADYKIAIPGLVADKVSPTARITMSCPLEGLNN
jgi:acetamidase/formamidase